MQTDRRGNTLERPPCPGGPLTGLRVIDLTTTILGPVATQLLGDLGADVIKVERPDGDPQRRVGVGRSPGMGPVFMGINRNKRSVVLDLKQSYAVEVLQRMVEKSDVIVHNMRPAAAARLGLSYEKLRITNPGLVYGSASGYTQNGPRRDYPAYDDVIQGQAGIAALNSDGEGKPRYLPMAFADKFVGYALAMSILAALYNRSRDGEGQEVRVPMYETTLSFTLHEHLWTRSYAPPSGEIGYPRMLSAHRRPYATKDGYICILAHTDKQVVRLFDLLDRPELRSDPRFAKAEARNANIDALYAIFGEAFKDRTSLAWEELLRSEDIACGTATTLDGLMNDSYLKKTGFFKNMPHPTEGNTMTTAIPFEFSRTTPEINRLAPRLGAHTAEVLREFGVDEHIITGLTSSLGATPGQSPNFR